jgi:hypothetical protein
MFQTQKNGILNQHCGNLRNHPEFPKAQELAAPGSSGNEVGHSKPGVAQSLFRRQLDSQTPLCRARQCPVPRENGIDVYRLEDPG